MRGVSTLRRLLLTTVSLEPAAKLARQHAEDYKTGRFSLILTQPPSHQPTQPQPDPLSTSSNPLILLVLQS